MILENEKDSLTAKNSNLSHSNFNCCDLSGTEIQCCNVSGVKMNDVNLTGINISNANVSELVIDGAQWGGAHFLYVGYGNPSQPDVEHNDHGVRFSSCNFQNGVMTDCNLTNVRLENCDISGLVINGVHIDQLLKRHAVDQK